MQAGRHDQVDATTEDLFEPLAKSDVPDESRHFVEVHEEVYVTFRPGIASRDGAEQIERAHSQRAQFLGVHGQPLGHLVLCQGCDGAHGCSSLLLYRNSTWAVARM